MVDRYFLCYRCFRHVKLSLLSDHKSPSGKDCCISCSNKILSKGFASKPIKKITNKRKIIEENFLSRIQ